MSTWPGEGRREEGGDGRGGERKGEDWWEERRGEGGQGIGRGWEEGRKAEGEG